LKKAVFLDRDGVLNPVVMRDGVVSSPWSRSEFSIPPEAVRLCDALRNEGWLIIVVTNQPDVARANLPAEELEAMHAEIQRVLYPDAIEVCTSGDDSDRRRKPNPGMLIDAARTLGIDLGASWMLGDSRKDIDAGRAAGVRTMLLATPYNSAVRDIAEFDASSLVEAAAVIINSEG
jgi:D-glycero-D-manno-heptose 1,7-bisphosphate phosphatase